MANIGDLTATLRANTTDFTAKMDAATASSAKLALALQDPVAQLRQLGIAAGQATGEQRALLVAQQQAIVEGMKAKGLVILNGQVAYSATAAAEAQTAMAAASVKAGIAGQGLGSNAQRLERSIGSLVTRMAGIPMQVGSIGTSLTRSILGTAGALAAVVAIGLVFAALSSLIDHFRAAAKAGEESAKRITDAWNKVTLKDQYDDVNKAMEQVIATQKKLEMMEANPRRQSTVLGATGQAETVTTGYSTAQIDAARLARNEANQQYKAAQDALNEALMGRPGVKETQKRNDRITQLREMGFTDFDPKNVAMQQLLGATDKDFDAAVANWKRVTDEVAKINYDAGVRRITDITNGPAVPGIPSLGSLGPSAGQLIASFRSQPIYEQAMRSGRQLSEALVQGVVEGDLTTRLTNGLKRVFEDVIARLIEQRIFDRLANALADALSSPSGGGSGGSGFLGFLGPAVAAGVGGALTGGLGALAFSQAATGVAGGNALAKSGGTNGTLIVNASGSMPRALGPVEHARDAQWLALWSETARVAPSLGIKVGVT